MSYKNIEYAQKEFGYFANPQHMKIHEDEYPQEGGNEKVSIIPIGIGTPIAERPFHTTGHRGHVSGCSAGQNRTEY